jgi:hypothetical protein
VINASENPCERVLSVGSSSLNFGSPREIVDWPESHLSNKRPDQKAAAFLHS